MGSAPKIAAVLMASGRGKRFGANKLLADFRGRPLIETVLERIPAERFFRVLVVTRYAEIAVSAAQRRFSVVENTSGEDDTAQTIRLGIRALPPGMDGCLFLVCDQPHLRKETIEALCQTFYQQPDRIVAPVCGGKRGNPVIFPRACFSELERLLPNQSGGAVLQAHRELLKTVAFDDPLEFADIDTPEELSALK